MSGGDLGPTEADDLLIGRLLSDRYRVLRKLGEGGMAAVYLAEHVVIQKKVALKILAPELARREELAARFLQEARAASRIGQENVIDISDFGRADGLAFFVMEYLEGHDLGAVLRASGAIGWPRARGIVVQICRALRAAHALGIIHRDLKPENVFLLEREGRADFVKLLDFGIAKVPGDATAADGPRLTRTGMIFGTPEYMAPEQAEGKPADHRADLYAVGCVLYHCLTGTAPFFAETFMAMLTKHLVEVAPPPSQRRPDLTIPPAVDALVAHALEKDRDRRFGSADEFMAAVLAIDEDGVPVTPAAVTRARTASGAATGVVSSAAAGLKTEVFAPARETQAMPPVSPPAPLRRFSILAVVGIALGIGAALFLVLRRGSEAQLRPAAVVAPGPGSVTTTPPRPAAAAPAEIPPSAPALHNPAAVPAAPAPVVPKGAGSIHPVDESAEAKTKIERKRPRRDLPRSPGLPERTAPPVPSDLKPFPG